MTPQDFVAKWRNNQLKERSGSQSHFIDLCALLGVLDPSSADPSGETFTFEKGASKTGGGEGWADVWKRGSFAWEYKGRHANLDKALAQLLQYVAALENPPLLIVSDMDVIRVHTNWTNTVQETHVFTLDDLLDGNQRDRLRAAFTDPERFKPGKTRQELTEETAGEFAALAQRLRERGHEAHVVAHFVNRLAFCMFAEDVELLPEKLFTRLLRRARPRPDKFAGYADQLFAAMRTGGEIGFTDIAWFNGGLFDDAPALPLTGDDIGDLLKAAERDWSQIDPSILGTLFERGLDPAKRSQLGAHYTDRAKIMLIVQPVIIDPLLAEWAEARARIETLLATAPRRTAERLLTPAERRKAERIAGEAAAIHSAFIERLADFRVLDPACGSGNFLYVALRAIKDIEHAANLDAEALGLPRGFPRTGPENVLGIELNPYAAELARVSVWIGEIQWMRTNGFEAGRNPILRPLDNIECRDALVSFDPGEQEWFEAPWPDVHVIVGNPPFLGDRKIVPELGIRYARGLRTVFEGSVPAGADLVCYWFHKAWQNVSTGHAERTGLVATNSIRGGRNRQVLKPIVDHGRIFAAWGDEGWTVEGAAVRVSIVCFDDQHGVSGVVDGHPVAQIFADLTASEAGIDLTAAGRLRSNADVAFQGVISYGPFQIDGDEARELLERPLNPNGKPNSEVIRPWINGRDITGRPSDHWIIKFSNVASAENAALFEGPWSLVEQRVRPFRAERNNAALNTHWWRLWRSRAELAGATRGLTRQLITPRVAKHRLFVWRSRSIVPDGATVAIARDDDTTFGILHSRFHELWSLRMGTSLEDRPRYTPSTTFETFPFPEGLTPDFPAADYAADPRAEKIAAAAVRLDELREAWLNPDDLVVREPEVVAGYPDRILPRDEEAAKELKKRTLTNLYNARPQWLANAHAALDEAVAEAYGWGDLITRSSPDAAAQWIPGADEEILNRLFHLNQERAAREAAADA